MADDDVNKVTYMRGTFHVDTSGEKEVENANQRRASLTLSTHNLISTGAPLPSLTKNIADHELSESEKKTLHTFSSLNYTPSSSPAYKEWLGSQGPRPVIEWDRWFLCGLIGILVGLIAALLKQSTTALGDIRLDDLKTYARTNHLTESWCCNFLWTAIYILIASFVISWIHPMAAGGGTPEIVAYLNGVLVHGVICLKQLIVKFIALMFTVSAGFPVGIQGPLIVFGACVGTGIGQFRSRTLGINPPFFKRFRNREDRRSFTTVGLAAGVSSGFDAPIGSLMLAMEDMSSFWCRRLATQTFFGAIIAILTAKLLNTALNGFTSVMDFGLLSIERVQPLNIHIATVAVAILLGLAGGIFGAVFTRLSVFMVNARKTIMAAIPNETAKKMAKMFDALLIAALWCTYGTYLPAAFSCDTFSLANYTATSEIQCFMAENNVTVSSLALEKYNCIPINENSSDEVTFNAVASLIQNPAGGIYPKAWKRGTHEWYKWHHCLTAFAIFTLGNIYVTTGCPVAGGIFVPLIVSGSLLGRAVGVGLIEIWKLLEDTPYPVHTVYWDWLDPGLIAVIGSASMLGGVTRLAIASTVFMVEMSRDIELAIPIMVAVLVARTVGEALSKSLWRSLTDMKGLPVLEQDPKILLRDRLVSLEMFEACDVMASPVETIRCIESLGTLCRILRSGSHGAIPVVRYDPETRHELVYGMITRSELLWILMSDSVHSELTSNTMITPEVDFEQLSVDIYQDPPEAIEKIEKMSQSKECDEIFVDLEWYVNQSVQKVDEHFSLYRTYNQFRALGLRHLLVTDLKNRVIGIITRKDLMQYKMQEKLTRLSIIQMMSGFGAGGYTGGGYSASGSSPPSNGHLNRGFTEELSENL
ncbi:hypothetical protein CAPTEDRAFT_205671 [Capitella teleta]|uniref:Chloride channel protein n=1 Tax=Capitella teleta TaxID=283909 RepID=R7TA58_CAPTE|nr:hypothetical protein CAPTEDRAFT_205671 [Capitella teleta]|eukprot:ELT90362.1 hypothetical protein CAPTEDRAFT_205671 [Capitella teleta]